MSCWCLSKSWLFLLNHGMWWYALCWVCLCCWLLFSVPLWDGEILCYYIFDLTIFESMISYIWFSFQSLWENWDVLNDLFLMMSCCDMFDLTILIHWSILLGYFLVAHWELMDIVIYHLILSSCSWRTNVNIVECLLMLFSWLLRTDWYCDLSLILSNCS